MAQIGVLKSSFGKRLGAGRNRVVALGCAFALVAAGVGAFAAREEMGVADIEVTRAGVSAGSDAAVGDASADDAAAAETAATAETAEMTRIVVHVDGAVAVPGVYRLEGDDVRVGDAIDAAGGLLEDAETSGVNLAAKLDDGMKVHIPTVDEATVQTEPVATQGAEVVNGGSAGSAASVSGGLININTADATQLMELPGVGEATAAAIIREREQGGPFASVEDIMRVSGIGEKKFAKMEGMICV